MPLALMLALTLMAGDPAPPDAVVATAPPAAPKPAEAAPAPPPSAGPDDIPPGAPTDDYGLVGWCYGALSEYLNIYDDIKPDLKAIDKMFGTPVVEAEPYHEDMAEARKAAKRFYAAMEAAEKASPTPIGDRGADAIAKGRSIWSVVRLKSRRNLVDAWLFWGVPGRCETTAKTLKTRSLLLGQAMASSAPAPEPLAKPADADRHPAAAAGKAAPAADGAALAGPAEPN